MRPSLSPKQLGCSMSGVAGSKTNSFKMVSTVVLQLLALVTTTSTGTPDAILSTVLFGPAPLLPKSKV